MAEREESSSPRPPLLAVVAGAALAIIAVAVVLVAVRRWRSESRREDELGESVSAWEGEPQVAEPGEPRERMNEVLARARVEDELPAAPGTPTSAGPATPVARSGGPGGGTGPAVADATQATDTSSTGPFEASATSPGTDTPAAPAMSRATGATDGTGSIGTADATPPTAVTDAATGPAPVRYGEPRDVVHVVESLVPGDGEGRPTGAEAAAPEAADPAGGPDPGAGEPQESGGRTVGNGQEERRERGDGPGRRFEFGGGFRAIVLLVAALIVAAVAVWYLFFAARPAV